MGLHVDSDVAYLVASKAKSRVAGYFYMSDNQETMLHKDQPSNNTPIHV